MTSTSCPACDDSGSIFTSNNSLQFRDGLILTILGCRNCGHRWMPTNSDEQRRIENSYSHQYAGFRSDEYFNKTVGDELNNRIMPLLPPRAKLLDVGCGNGEFLLAASNMDLACTGVDISSGGVEIARSKGLNAFAADFLTHDFPDHYDCITMWDVAEHLRKPVEFFKRAAELLGDGGYLVVKIPSFGALNFTLLRLLKRRSPILLGAPDHMQYFTRLSLAKALRHAGFSRICWFPSRRFRSKPPTQSLKRKLSRVIQRRIGQLAGNHNLYAMVAKNSMDDGKPGQLPGYKFDDLDLVQ